MLAFASHLQQVAADGVQPVVPSHPADQHPARRSIASPASGPSTIAAAMARLSATIGLSDIRASSAVEREDLRPVRILGARCLVVHRRDGGLQLVGADRPARERGADERHALVDLGAVPQASVLLVERNELAVGSRSRARVARR